MIDQEDQVKSTPLADEARAAREAHGRDRLLCLSDLAAAAPVPHIMAVPVFLRVLAAVETMHRAHGCSCNLDPRKVILHADGKVELSPRAKCPDGMTAVIASSKYTAPELVLGTAANFEAAVIDSYALGFVFYEILLGSDLFRRQFAEVIRHGELGWMYWHADRDKQAEPLSKLLDTIPSTLSQMIDGMMSKESTARTTELDKIADNIAATLQTTSVLSGLSALCEEAEARAAPRSAALGGWLNLWKTLVARLENKARQGRSRVRSSSRKAVQVER